MERNFSQRVRNVLGYSREEAERLHTPIIGPEHLLLGILRDGTGKAVEALRYLGIQPERLKTAVEELLLSHPYDTPAEASPSQENLQILHLVVKMYYTSLDLSEMDQSVIAINDLSTWIPLLCV